MKNIVLLIAAVSASLAAYGRTLTFVTSENTPIPEVRCVGYSADNDSVASWISDNKGCVTLTTDGIRLITASNHDFSDKVIFCDKLKSDNETIVMSPASQLDEVVVTPDDVEEFATHTSYRISESDMERYSNTLMALNTIPNVTILSNGGVFFEGNQDIKLLIDGVDATPEEIKTLSKDDIAKVDVYQTPPLRFVSQGISAVLDIRLKSKIHGGNGAVDISQAFAPLKGENVVALFYNYKQSRFTFNYFNENSHFKKKRISEVLDYDFDGINYNKVKKGLDSKNHYDDNSLNLTYQINRPKDFLYNIRTGLDFNRNHDNSRQQVTTRDQSFLATNILETDYTKFNVANYFEKHFGDKGGTLLANINYQHYSTNYNSAYNEMSDDPDALRDSHSKYKTRLDGVFSELQYQLPADRLGMFSFCAYETYKRSRYIDTANPFSQTVNVLGGYAEWMYRKGNVRWWLDIGVDWYRTASTLLAKSHNLVIPSPLAVIDWRPNQFIRFRLRYAYTGGVPSIAQLSETNQWLDTRLVYHGNSTLKPYKSHNASLSFTWNNRFVNLSWYNSLISSPGRICDMYTVTDRYMLQTLVNLSEYRELTTQLTANIMPLGNDILTFWNRIILADLRGSNDEYSWKGHRFQWMSELSLNLKHWTFSLYYQYPGKVAEGQLIRPRAQCWSATVLYRPISNLSVGLECFMPFGKGFKESEYTVKEAPVYADTEINVIDRCNLVSLKLSYNFDFGRNRNRARPQFGNEDNDSGLLRK